MQRTYLILTVNSHIGSDIFFIAAKTVITEQPVNKIVRIGVLRVIRICFCHKCGRGKRCGKHYSDKSDNTNGIVQHRKSIAAWYFLCKQRNRQHYAAEQRCDSRRKTFGLPYNARQSPPIAVYKLHYFRIQFMRFRVVHGHKIHIEEFFRI